MAQVISVCIHQEGFNVIDQSEVTYEVYQKSNIVLNRNCDASLHTSIK